MFGLTVKKARGAAAGALLGLSLVAPQLGLATIAQAQENPADKALAWMKTQQQPDGSFAGFGAGSTVDAVLAIEAAGQDPARISNGGKSAVDFLESKVTDFAKTPGSAGKALLAVSALPAPFSASGTKTLVDAINASYSTGGHYGQDAIGHAFAMLGLVGAGQLVPQEAVRYLESIQGSDGGWAFTGDTAAGSADTNTTAVAVQALVAAGVSISDPVLQKAHEYLKSQANDDGGWPYQKGSKDGGESDVNSTSYVLQALQVLQGDTRRASGFVLSMQKPSGAFQWTKSQPDDNPGATYQAVPAILGVTLVPKSVTQVPEPNPPVVTPGMPSTGQASDGLPLPVAAMAAMAMVALVAGLVLRLRPARCSTN